MATLTRMFLAVAAIVAGCTVHDSTTRAAGPYDMTCSKVFYNDGEFFGLRCENSEVFCYEIGYGLSCFQKGVK